MSESVATFFVGQEEQASDGEIAGSAEIAELKREAAARQRRVSWFLAM
ncbi:hypothetical protein SO078_28905 (plasmid) [Sinorhizobium meliloti]|nr:hypothetical protein [Sinorhizobium meliloti]WRQ71256.1 hypothetical protein SO078_28905 [Sinorhizobium meliloti]